MFYKSVGIFFRIYFLIVNINVTFAWFEACNQNFQLTNNVNTVWQYNSPNYPAQYPAGSSCKTQLIAPTNYQISISCTTKLNEYGEYLYISTNGDNTLQSNENFVGNQNVVRQSTKNQMTVAFVLSGSQRSGTFTCSIRVFQTATNVPSPTQQCDCGWSVSPKISGGVEAAVNEFPFMCALIQSSTNELLCGCAIISSRYVVTCAHCLVAQGAANLVVRVGAHNVKTSYTADYRISSSKIHEGYVKNTDTNDIALIATSADIKFSQGVRPVCLPFNYLSTMEGYQVDIMGYGTTSFAGPKSNTLMKATVKVVSNTDCKKTYPTLQSTQICTLGTGEKDSCQFDSGGPVVYRSSRMFLYGLTSFGKECGGGQPSVSTRVTSYLKWIRDNTAGTSFCVK